ncbi:MAG: purU [Bacilli bacterium]|nr:purU [Bacilli bacterium]
MNHLQNRARMLISCPDQPGIVATVSRFLYEQGANIVDSDQHTTDPSGGLFFMRIEFDLPKLEDAYEALERRFEEIARPLQMSWRIAFANRVKKIAIFVSKEDHCLLELLWRKKSGELGADIAMVISNHPDLRETVEAYRIPFYHIPVTSDTKQEAERQQLELVKGQVDLVVLARYMQIISPHFIDQYPNSIINIHHSFLPAFVGGNPYAQAYKRGVKIIGATAHYITEDLDAGPIIEQDVQRVNHKDQVEDLKRIGRHIERTVFAKAVNWHVEDRILVYGNKTVVFV